MNTVTKFATVLSAAGLLATSAHGGVRISEWTYSSIDGEWIELVNLGPGPVDMTGWSFDDDSRTAGSFPIGSLGVVAVGEAVILCDVTAAAFRASWALPGSVKIADGNTNNLARNDEINIYDASNTLVDRLTFGDQNFPGTIRTQNKSGWNTPVGTAPWGNVTASWVLSAVGDAQNSYASASGDLGSPGSYVPAPGTIALMGLAGLVARRRR